MKITGEYKFKIFKDGDWYIAEGTIPNKKGTIITQGKTPEEIFEMIADAYLCVLEIKVSKWERIKNVFFVSIIQAIIFAIIFTTIWIIFLSLII